MSSHERIKQIFNKEIIRYGLSGIILLLLNYGVFYILEKMGILYVVANGISLIIGRIIGYILNKYYVFHSTTNTVKDTVKEFLKFISARGVSGILDFVGIIVLVELFNIDTDYAKIICILIVIIINYYLSKKYIFSTGET